MSKLFGEDREQATEVGKSFPISQLAHLSNVVTKPLDIRKIGITKIAQGAGWIAAGLIISYIVSLISAAVNSPTTLVTYGLIIYGVIVLFQGLAFVLSPNTVINNLRKTNERRTNINKASNRTK